MSRTNPQANDNAEELLNLLERKFQEEPTFGYTINYIAEDRGWSYSKTRDTILWCRNQMIGSRYLIHTFKKGRRWYYKVPSLAQAQEYEHARGVDVARRSGHVLLMVRKRAVRFGVTQETDRRAKAYTEMLRWLTQAGVTEAEDILAQALRDIPERNGAGALSA